MNTNRFQRVVSAAVLGLAGLASPTYAQTRSVSAEIASMDDIAANVGGARVQQRISADFSAFAGSEANARNLVAGLHSGGTIALTGASGSAQGTSTITITPPTRPMGYGEIYVALSLAKQQLAAQGIANPTPQQLQLALTGGTAMSGNPPHAQSVQGVLQLRNQGMGWGQIAGNYRINLGPVLASMRSANERLSGLAGATTGATSGSASASAAVGARAGLHIPPPRVAGDADIGLHGQGNMSAGDADDDVNARGSAQAGGAASMHTSPLPVLGGAGGLRGILR